MHAVVKKKEAATKEKVTIINELRPQYTLKILLAVSGIASSTYKYNNKIKDKDAKNKARYGYRLITHTLRSQGVIVNHKKK